jgi:hypothetical protein
MNRTTRANLILLGLAIAVLAIAAYVILQLLRT